MDHAGLRAKNVEYRSRRSARVPLNVITLISFPRPASQRASHSDLGIAIPSRYAAYGRYGRTIAAWHRGRQADASRGDKKPVMAYGDLMAEAVRGAQDDMSLVDAAAQKILGAIRSAAPWLGDQTWTGQAATAWCGDWDSFYRQVQSLLANQLPGAEAQVVSQVRTQMQQLARQHHGAVTPS